MEENTASLRQLATTAKHFTHRLAIIGENRLELLAVELQEERERILHVFLLALGVVAIGMLAGITLTALIVVLFWAWPLAVLLSLTLLYSLAGICLYRRLTGLLQNWQTLSASLDQLRKDRVCLEKILA